MNDIKLYKTILKWKYSFITLTAITIAVTSLAFFTHEQAWLFLGFAGTALSIVLSVIAIVITLVDVAGQKQQVVEISESSRQLRELLNKQKKDYDKMKSELDVLVSEELIGVIQNYQDTMQKFSEEVKANYINDENKDDFDKLAETFSKDIDLKYKKLRGDLDTTFTMYLDYDLNYKEMNELERDLRNEGLFVSLSYVSDKIDDRNSINELHIDFIDDETNPKIIKETVNKYIKKLHQMKIHKIK